jgi:hypothetical protein
MRTVVVVVVRLYFIALLNLEINFPKDLLSSTQTYRQSSCDDPVIKVL